MLAVVGLELMPEALQSSRQWVPIAAFVAGGAVVHGPGTCHRFRPGPPGCGGKKSTGPLAIYSGVSIDLFSDGIMIGTGSVLNPALGLLLALGQVPADVPEGFVATATLRRAGTKVGPLARPRGHATVARGCDRP